MIKVIEERLKNNQFVLIAEIGVNYYDIATERNMSPIEAAKLMIDEAAKAGVHAVKFQSYKADTLASTNSPYYWDLSEEPTDSQYKLFKKYDSFGVNEYKELSLYSEQCGVEFLSTAFDIESADYLESLMNVYKISSSDLNNLNFVKYQAQKNKPMILSVGASNEDEIRETVELIREYNNKTLVLMHCVLEYPTPYEHANLNKINTLMRTFPNLRIGYSDHTRPDKDYRVLTTAYNMGARIIEKHFTLNKALKGNDHYHAMDVKDVRNIVSCVDYIDSICGDGELKCLASERKARENARRSLVAACFMKKGEIVTDNMITWKRPGNGIGAQHYGSIIGRRVMQDIAEDTVLQWNMFM